VTPSNSHRIAIGRTPEGKAAIASTASPFFLFEADTEAEVIAIARRALSFYSKGAGQQRPRVSPAHFTWEKAEDILVPA
jgi:hypothetical protein